MEPLQNPTRGKFIVFEGIDGSGLTTHASRLARWLHRSQGAKVHLTKEPSAGPVGAMIRLGLSGRMHFDPRTFALMFAADRLDHVCNDVEPKLASGVHVICDRYCLSSYAYQSLDLDLDWVMTINRHAPAPDLTIFIDVPPHVTFGRISRERHNVEVYETEATLTRVRENYHSIIARLASTGQKIEMIPGTTEKGIRDVTDTGEDVRRAAMSILRS